MIINFKKNVRHSNQHQDMYIKLLNKDGSTKHSSECTAAFGRKDMKCHRCVELANGAKSKTGWQQEYFKRKKDEQERTLKEIKEHDCKKEGCMYICTANQW